MRTVLAQPAFRRLWLGQSLSAVGDSLVVVVIGLYVTELTGSATDVGIVLAAYAGSLVLFLALGGVVADRLPRRRVMIGADVVRFALHSLLAALIAFDAVEIWHMVAIGILFGVAEAFFRPAATGLLPQTVPEELIQPAQALTGASREIAVIAGPALGTLLLVTLGAAAAFAFDALTFLASICFLVRLSPRERGASHARAGMLTELREGFVAVRERAWVWATIAAFSITLLAGVAPLFTLGASVAQQHYGTAEIYGVVQILWGCGTFVGSVVAMRWRPLRPLRAAMLWTLPWPACFLTFGLGAPLAAVVAGSVIGGFGIGLFGVWWETALAERIPPHLLSRVSSYDWMGSLALMPLGFVLAGVLGDLIGPAETLVGGSLVCVVALALGLVPRQTRALRRIEPEVAGAEPVRAAVGVD